MHSTINVTQTRATFGLLFDADATANPACKDDKFRVSFQQEQLLTICVVIVYVVGCVLFFFPATNKCVMFQLDTANPP